MSYTPKHFKLPDDKVLPKDEAKGILPYVFTDAMAIAIDVALATNRPLLVSGNPGCGKSRLADALAELQSWSNLSCTITSRTRLESLTVRTICRRMCSIASKSPAPGAGRSSTPTASN